MRKSRCLSGFSIRVFAEAGGFEPPVQLPVRQFSKLVVSATHPHFQVHVDLALANGGANIEVSFELIKKMTNYFVHLQAK